MEALRRAIRTSADGKLAHQQLVDIGVVPKQGSKSVLLRDWVHEVVF